MKKRLLMLLSLTALGAMLLTGCGARTNQTTTGQTTTGSGTVTQQQVADDTGSAAPTTETTTTTDTKTNTNTASNTNTTTAIASFSELEKNAAEAIQKADAATAAGNRESDQKLYLEHKSALEAVDRAIDVYEDDLEAKYRNGELTYEEYRTKDAEAEKLEDSLDAAEDRLENKFGIDD